MLQVRTSPLHVRQSKSYSCGAAAFASIFAVSEAEAMKLVSTTRKGTSLLNVHHAIKGAEYIDLNQNYLECWWLENLSSKYPLYLACEYLNLSLNNRKWTRRHAVACVNGFFYDPAENNSCPIGAYEHTFTKAMNITGMIIVDSELKTFQKNLDCGLF